MPLLPTQIARFRASVNPLRSLTMSRVVSLQEQGEQGTLADLMWLYRHMERHFGILRTVKTRREAAMSKLDWEIKISKRANTPALLALAEKQQAALLSAYEQIENLEDARNHLATAEFRGYAHLEKVHRNEDANQPVIELRPVEQWFWCRSQATGEWLYNANASQTNQGIAFPAGRLIVREVEAPIDDIAIKAMLRANLSEVDWDGFLELYGIPGIFIELPPGTPPDKVQEYQDLCDHIIADIRGTLPAGAKVTTVTTTQSGTSPFKERLDHLREEVTLAATGGLLSVLTAPTGLGSGQGTNHADAFDTLALAEAKKISSIFQRQFDKPFMAANFPGQPNLVYFAIASVTEEDLDSLAERLGKLNTAGLQADPLEMSEKFGITLTRSAPALPGLPGPLPTAHNRAPAPTAVDPAAKLKALMAAQAKDLAPLRTALEPILAKLERGEKVSPADLPDFGKFMRYDATAAALEEQLAEAVVQGAQSVPKA